MAISFDEMPSWVIVAVISRVARHIQDFLKCSSISDQKVVNDAIQVAEESARHGRVDERASELSDKARKVYEDAKNGGQAKASWAALCAAEAATAVCVVNHRQSLIEAAERALECVRAFCIPERDRILEEEIERLGRLAHGLAHDDPAPPEMLNFLHEQAVHEAGHAVAACLLSILLCEVRIIYEAGGDPVRNPIAAPDEFSCEERSRYCLFYAAGAAAEDLVFGRRQECWSDGDRDYHARCGGADFDEDASRVRQIPGFNCQIVIEVASLLEKRHRLSGDEVEQIVRHAAK